MTKKQLSLKSTLGTKLTETVLWGCKVEDPDHKEEILYTQKGYVNTEKLLKDIEPLALSKGYNRLRIAVYDLNEKPDFIKAINI